MWDMTVGGSAVSADTSQVAAEREVSEEIGYELNYNTRKFKPLNGRQRMKS